MKAEHRARASSLPGGGCLGDGDAGGDGGGGCLGDSSTHPLAAPGEAFEQSRALSVCKYSLLALEVFL